MAAQIADLVGLSLSVAAGEAWYIPVRAAMEGAFALAAPLKADVEVGANWEEMEAR